MIIASLWVMLLGMAGVFVVMGIIAIVIGIMYNLTAPGKKKTEK